MQKDLRILTGGFPPDESSASEYSCSIVVHRGEQYLHVFRDTPRGRKTATLHLPTLLALGLAYIP
jgi:hypothetical protein